MVTTSEQSGGGREREERRVGLEGAFMRERHVIDAFKLLTAPVVLACMAYFNAWNDVAAWLYLGLHGTYGMLWVAKSRIFPDRQWEKPLGLFRAALLVTGLSLYWLGGVLVCARHVGAPGPLVAVTVALFGVGVFLHFAADMQKHVALELRPGQLIDDKLFARLRNPNYLGELLIYGSFALLSQHWAPWAVLAFAFAIEWLPNMIRKDRSLSRYPGFAQYRQRSGMLTPWA